VAKAALWAVPDAKTRKLGEQTGLETPVVLAVNDGDWVWGVRTSLCRSKRDKSPAWGLRPQG
jgi:hypothetical protein